MIDYNPQKSGVCWTILFTFFLSSGMMAARAEPIEEARQLFEQKRYSEVDRQLRDLLDQASPPAEALRLSLDAAMADGRFFTARQRCDALLDDGGRKDPKIVYLGGHLAKLTSDTTREAELLSLYVTLAPKKSDTLRRALSRLVAIGNKPESVSMYFQLYGENDDFNAQAIAMLPRLYETGEAAAFVELSDRLLKQFENRPELSYLVAEHLRHAADGGLLMQMPGKPADGSGKIPKSPTPNYRRYSRAVELLLSHKIHDPGRVWELLIRSDQQTPAAILRFLELTSPMSRNDILKQCRSSRCWSDNRDQIPADAARRFLALESKYRASPDRQKHLEFFNFIAQVRHIFGDEMTLAKAETLFLPLKKRFQDDPTNRELIWITEGIAGYAKTVDELGHYVKRHRDVVPPYVLRNYIESTQRHLPEPERFDAFRKFLGNDPMVCFEGNTLAWLRASVEKDIYRDTLQTVLPNRPGGIETVWLKSEVMDPDTLTIDEKTAILKRLYETAGYGQLLRDLIAYGKTRDTVKNESAFKKFVKSVKQDKLGSDPALSALARAFLFTPRNGQAADPNIHALMEPALKAYGAKFPAGRPNDDAMRQALRRYYEVCQYDGESCKRFVEIVLPHMGAKGPWNSITEAARRSNDPATKLSVLETCLPMKVPSSQISQDTFREHKTPDSGSPFLVSPFYGQFSFRTCWDSIKYQVVQTDQFAAGLDEAAKLLMTLRDEDMSDGYTQQSLGDFGNTVSQWQALDPEKKIPEALTNALLKRIVTPHHTSHGALHQAMSILQYAGQRDRAVKTYRVHLDKLDSVQRVRALTDLYQMLHQGKEELIVDEIVPLMKKLDEFDLARVTIPYYVLSDLDNLISRGQMTDAMRDRLREARSEIAELVASGATVQPYNRGGYYDFFALAVPGELEKRQYERSLRLIRGALANCTTDRARELLSLLRDQGQWELLYIASEWIPTRDKDLVPFAQQLRGIAAAKIPGIFPVDASHPAFPVYVASSELARGNEPRAWELLRGNVRAFAKQPLQFDLSFTVWAVDKLRRIRGANDTLLKQAQSLCDEILAEEDNLDAEFAANIALIRADTFRDLGRLEASELEYKSLLSNPRLQKTEGGRTARYRLVELMVVRGNTSGANVEVDRWLAFPDPKLHTQAYYFKALMAYEDEDYKVCRENLNKVFEREYGHEEARLLEGEWRKKTRALEDTDVYAGRQIEMSRITPGQELKLSIHDQNLSVIGKDSFIPVLVTTSNGKDREIISLYPAPRTPNLFRARLATQLGNVDPGNLILEVNGSDQITYEIDPTFVHERGLDALPAKTLQVVDDAWLSSSSGRLLTEEEQKELALQRQVAAIRGESSGRDLKVDGRIVRPGNPLYVMVRDRDRDIGSNADTLSVTVATSSGDTIESAPLIETGPHTGIFRGSVATGVPLPRAEVSDSAEGSDPAVLINSSKTGFWSSRPDAAADKWVEVDTMGSHLVKQVTLAMPKPDAIKQLTLSGAFAGDPIRLGQFPKVDEAVQDGLTLRMKRHDFGRNEVTLSKMRAAMRDVSDEPVSIDRPELAKGINQSHAGLIRGTFYLDKGRPTTLSIISDKPSEQLAIYLLIDGQGVLGGRVNRMESRSKEVYLAEGPHRLDVFFVQHSKNARFSIGQLSADGQFETLPKQWFDMEQNEGLRAFLQNKAVIERTPEGYIARFSTPIRLRKLRWQFNEYVGTTLRVSEIGVTDEKDETILPVPRDYSTGLDNNTLEIAPGDAISVTYRDRRNSKDSPRTLSSRLGAGFADASAGFACELKAGIGQSSLYAEAYRFKPGEQLTVTVNDPDADISEKADTVDVLVRTATGEELTLQAIEAQGLQDRNTNEYHSGTFHAILKTSTTEETAGDTIRVAKADHLEATYMDQENTSPGVPTLRVSNPLPTTSDEPSEVTYFRVWSEREPNRRNPDETVSVEHSRPLTAEESAPDPLVLDASHPLRFEVKNASRALHESSEIEAWAVSQSELDAAKEQNRTPRKRPIYLTLGGGNDTELNSIFQADLPLKIGGTPSDEDALGQIDRSDDAKRKREMGPLYVLGADTVHLTILGPDGEPEITKSFRLATDGQIGLFDKNYENPDADVHMGEKFFVQVVDPDQDRTSDHDAIIVSVRIESESESASKTPDRTMTLTETLPHSGIFSGSLHTEFIGPTPKEATSKEATPKEDETDITASGIQVCYGDTVSFTYDEQTTIPDVEPGLRSVSGTVLLGSDGQVHLFSKRFKDMETGSRVQFRMAECLFEMAKEYRKVKNTQMASGAIARGKQILEEAMQDYPNTTLVTEGQYLLANLYQELGSEEMAAKHEKEAIKLYQQAVSRFSAIISTWPDSPYAARAQFHKAICLEKLGDFKQSSEEYVRLCYAYPDSPLVADATIRLATHFYRQARYNVSGRIYESFARQYPSHAMAPKVLFMAAMSHMKQAETWSAPDFKGDDRLIGRDVDEAIQLEYTAGAKALDFLTTEMKDETGTNLRAQSMYWCGVAYRKAGDLPTAYLRIKQVTFEYPETKWARMARGLLYQDEELQRQGEEK